MLSNLGEEALLALFRTRRTVRRVGLVGGFGVTVAGLIVLGAALLIELLGQ